MARILIMEGNPKARRERGAQMGIRSTAGIYADSVHAHFPEIEIDILCAADEDGALPAGRSFHDYDAMIISGSSLHAYNREPEVTRQLDTLHAVSEIGLPVLGSCWGLQIAAVAAGGEVIHNPRGREVGIARKVMRNEAGKSHAFLSKRPDSFDAPCIHYDEVSRLPANATLLASNSHSEVQAAIIPLRKSEIWAVQYHPEFDLPHLGQLYRLYEADMLSQGFFTDKHALDDFADKLSQMSNDSAPMGLAWQLGVDHDILNPVARRSEIIAFIEHRVLGQSDAGLIAVPAMQEGLPA